MDAKITTNDPGHLPDPAAAFHALIEGVREGAAILAFDCTVLTCNRRLAEMLKLECEQVMGRPLLEFISIEDQPRFEELVQSAPEEFRRLHLRLSGGNAFPLPTEIALRSLSVGGRRVFSLIATDVSRRRRAEEQLAFQAHLLFNVSDAILAMDEHFRITFWNPAAELLYGWTADEVLGRTASEVIHPELSLDEQSELNQQLVEKGRFDNQGWHHRKDHTPIWVEAKRIVLRGAEGRMFGYVSVNRDMTERKRADESLREAMDEIRRLNAQLEQRVQERTARLDAAKQGLEREIAEHQRVEEALRQSEGRFRTLVTSVNEGFTLNQALYDENGALYDFRVLEANAAAEIANGLTREDFVGKTWRELWPGAEPYWWDICIKVVVKGEQVVYENYAVVHDRWYQVHQFAAGPDLMGSLFTDITERKRADQEREQMLAQIEQERARWQGVVEGIADEVWVCNTDGKMSLINLPEMTAMGLDEFQDKTVEQVYEEVDILNPDGQMRPLDQAPLLRSLHGQVVRGEEIMRHRQTGKTRYRQYSAAPIRDAAGAITGAVAIVRDVTEYKKAEQEIVRLNETLATRAIELESANRELESFSYSVSHDLRAPLASINGLLRTLLADYGTQLPEHGKRLLGMIHANVFAMNHLIEDLLMLSRATRQPLSRQAVDMTALVRQVIRELYETYAGRQVEITVRELAAAQADPNLLKQVWVNLLSNALKYTRRCDLARIEIGSYDKEGETVYVVKDNGVGFDPAQAEKLFGVFQRLHSEEEYEGTGIGLAIVERIIRRHGGNVRADGQVDQGATFYFTLR